MTSSKYNFVKLRMKKCPSVEGWYLKISSFIELVEYFIDGRKGLTAGAFISYGKSFNKEESKFHHTSDYANMVEFLSDITGRSFLFQLSECEASAFDSMSKVLLNTEFKIAVNFKGGFTIFDKNTYDVVDTVESEKFIFPSDKKISVSQWPGGKHWYARVGNTDVVVDGANKWSTYETAEKMAHKFMEGNGQ